MLNESLFCFLKVYGLQNFALVKTYAKLLLLFGFTSYIFQNRALSHLLVFKLLRLKYVEFSEKLQQLMLRHWSPRQRSFFLLDTFLVLPTSVFPLFASLLLFKVIKENDSVSFLSDICWIIKQEMIDIYSFIHKNRLEFQYLANCAFYANIIFFE